MLPDSFVAQKTAPLIALGIYALLYLLGAWLLWCAERRRERSSALDRISRSPALPWLIELLRLVYYLLLPYYMLVQGVISAQVLGVGEQINWPSDILRASGWTLFALFLLGLAWSARAKTGNTTSGPQRRSGGSVLSGPSPWGWLYSLREAAYLEMSWGFYRAACQPFAGNYYGAFLGLGFVYLIGWLNPATRAGLRLSGQRETIIHTAALALCSTVLYTQTGNLWLCLAMHVLLELVLAWWVKTK